MAHAATATQSPFQGRVGWFQESGEYLILESDDTGYVNFAQILRQPKSERNFAFDRVLSLLDTACRGRPIEINTSDQFLNVQISPYLVGAVSTTTIDELLDCITYFFSLSHNRLCSPFAPDPFPRYDIAKHAGLVRVGNVELRVIENFLRDPQRLRIASNNVVRDIDDEALFYGPSAARSWCTADDFEWNLRKLMTNAGFYTARDRDLAWAALETWAIKYATAMKNNNLASYMGSYLFCFASQIRLWQDYGGTLKYVQHPDAFGIYEQFRDKKILFLSPLADFAAEQYNSGRLWNLYKNYMVPRFELITLPAFVSTWPNRPHRDWVETFSVLCQQIDEIADERGFDVFTSTCGCYGLPLSEYVREKYGASVLYLGNITNAFFGVLQNGTLDFMASVQNRENFLVGDLKKYPNVHLIDAGRYV